MLTRRRLRRRADRRADPKAQQLDPAQPDDSRARRLDLSARVLIAATAVVLSALVVLLGGPGAPSFAQAPSTTDPAERCAQVKPTIVFVGRVTRIVEDTASMRVDEVRSGDGEAGTDVEIRYPTKFNVGYLELGEQYLVAAVKEGNHLNSVVPTADLRGCGQYTRTASDEPIDTSALSGVREQGPRLLKLVIAGVFVALVLLILIGRFFDRKSRYRVVKVR